MIHDGDVINYKGEQYINVGGTITHPITGIYFGYTEGEFPTEKWRRQVYMMYLLEKAHRNL
ncbi:hypothetical protein M199_gp279 [Halogranum tailed virus 1]|uniref:Uncharacterized protein n=1 Tax=Halogranum tailed virus 1 TaxID=1273749 RepID=R4TL56_9CAUD|nr:hypothetical protein M199_gp279 [Halogranum tailed virus 1]AGM11387.1 hypothetical protein HGTV1_61 [Halogranum tailed virus 1]